MKNTISRIKLNLYFHNMINKVGLAKCIELFVINERCTEL